MLALTWSGILLFESLRHSLATSGEVTPLSPRSGPPALALVVTHDPQRGPLFPWQPRGRWRLWAWKRLQAAQRAYQRAVWAARFARLARRGMLTMAMIVDWLTRAQLRRQLQVFS